MLNKELSHKEHPDERRLLKEMSGGDYAAFTKLYQRYVKPLTHYGFKFTNDIQIVEDSIHDLFVWLWNKRNCLHINYSLKSYLLKAVRTSILQKINKGRKQVLLKDDAYLAANPFNAGQALQQINTQYWVASFLNGSEAWANFRRSGFPPLQPNPYPGADASVKGDFIHRLVYPVREKSVNTTNYNEAVARMGADNLATRVFWDK